MVEPARFVARAMAGLGQPVFVYRFDYVTQARRAQSPFGAEHSTEIAYVFDRLGPVDGSAVTPGDTAVAARMADYWAAFARTGDPNGTGRPHWPRYAAAEDRLL